MADPETAPEDTPVPEPAPEIPGAPLGACGPAAPEPPITDPDNPALQDRRRPSA
jgi:hypothetical protein